MEKNVRDYLVLLQNCLYEDYFDVKINEEEGFLEWRVVAPEDDDANVFNLWFDPETGDAGWEAENIMAGGHYYKPITNYGEFDQAIQDWENDSMTWND